MKIIRFLNEEGKICLGSIETDRPEEARIVRGDLFGKLEMTGQMCRIGRLLSPLVPQNILVAGFNYSSYIKETKVTQPDNPIMYIKATTSVIGSDESILLPVALEALTQDDWSSCR